MDAVEVAVTAPPDPRDRDQSVAPEPSWGEVALLLAGLALYRACVALGDAAEWAERWLVRRGYPT